MKDLTISNFINARKIIFIRFIIIVFCASVQFQVFATKYFVSNSTGKDSYNGLSENTAWKTLAKVQAVRSSFKPGDIIAFKAGDTWVEPLYLTNISGTKENPIIFTSYGIGKRPIFTVVEKQSLTWTKIGGNIWRETTTANRPNRVIIDGKEVLTTYIYAELGSKVPDLVQVFWGDRGDDKNYLYVYSPDSPSNHSIEFASSPNGRALYISLSDYLIIKNIEFQGGYYETITIYGCTNIIFDNIKSGVMSRMGIVLYKNYETTPASDNEKITIKNSLFDTEFTLDYSFSTTNGDTEFRGAFDGIWVQSCNVGEISNCIIKNWGHAGLQLLSTSNIEDEAQNIKIFKNRVTAPDLPYGGTIGTGVNSSFNEIYNNLIVDGAGMAGIAGNHTHYHHNIFLRIRTSTIKTYPTGFGITFQTDSEGSGEYGSEENIIENNIFYECESGGVRLSGNNSGKEIKNNLFQNNIIFNCGSEHNNFAMFLEGDYNIGSNNQNTFINNLIYNSVTLNTIKYYGKTMTVSIFNLQTSHSHTISNNIFGDPKFVNATDDWHLQSDSPAIDAGISSLATKDYDGNTIPFSNTLPDIGIFEFIDSAHTVPVSSITVEGLGGTKVINDYNSTLQIIANVLPVEATNKNIFWSVINGTGEAVISNSGILQAISDGIVTVDATAQDGSGIKGSMNVTISTQSPPEDEASAELIKVYPNPTNGLFTIETNDDSPGDLILKVFNNDGSYIQSIPIQSNGFVVDLMATCNGFYILKLYRGIKLLGTTGLVKL